MFPSSSTPGHVLHLVTNGLFPGIHLRGFQGFPETIHVDQVLSPLPGTSALPPAPPTMHIIVLSAIYRLSSSCFQLQAVPADIVPQGSSSVLSRQQRAWCSPLPGLAASGLPSSHQSVGRQHPLAFHRRVCVRMEGVHVSSCMAPVQLSGPTCGSVGNGTSPSSFIRDSFCSGGGEEVASYQGRKGGRLPGGTRAEACNRCLSLQTEAGAKTNSFSRGRGKLGCSLPPQTSSGGFHKSRLQKALPSKTDFWRWAGACKCNPQMGLGQGKGLLESVLPVGPPLEQVAGGGGQVEASKALAAVPHGQEGQQWARSRQL